MDKMMTKVAVLAIFFTLLLSCEKTPYGYNTDPENYDKLILNNIDDISWHDCLYESEDKILICLDSVLNDSRCPEGVVCVWEGNAEVKFKFKKYPDEPVYFNLNTNRGFTYQTVIDGYKITLVSLNPYPVYGRVIRQKDYKAEILIQKE